ncbi:hypothetical protein OUZ56_006368 [Daphnia magna]|uniref:Uncharacterized protein n=1 Tax=Daphnia magna TaxID=35525 RepID=A0ABQ9YVF7_9CRUS|nr:hypothetical protein OUZ56_006368 [Daphnia magna]
MGHYKSSSDTWSGIGTRLTILFPHLSLEFWDGSCCCRTLLGSLVKFQKAAFQEQEYNLPAVNSI